MNDRYILSPAAKRRRKIIERINLIIAGCCGIGIYVLTGLALKWLGVA